MLKVKSCGSMKQEVIDTDGNGTLKVPPSAKLQGASLKFARSPRSTTCTMSLTSDPARLPQRRTRSSASVPQLFYDAW